MTNQIKNKKSDFQREIEKDAKRIKELYEKYNKDYPIKEKEL